MHRKMTAQNLSEKNKKEGCCSCSLDLNHVSCIAPPGGWSWTLKKKDPPKNKQPLQKNNNNLPKSPNNTARKHTNNQKGGWQGKPNRKALSLSLSLSLTSSAKVNQEQKP
jgi:hypothetical protein